MSNYTKIIIAGIISNFIETFDLALCGLLVFFFAKYLINDVDNGLLIVLVLLFIGYFTRPLGAMFFGLLSDLLGRKFLLLLSTLSMGITTMAISFIPSVSLFGLNSLIILLCLRVMQNFFCSAEYANSVIYLVESADKIEKGYIGSWAAFGSMLGFLLASCFVLIVMQLTKIYPHYEWLFWRLPFMFGLFGSIIGLYMRSQIPESLEYIIYYASQPKMQFNFLVKYAFYFLLKNKLQALYAILLSCFGIIITLQIYIPIQSSTQFSMQQLIISNILSFIIIMILSSVFGKLSDKIDRNKIIMIASLLLCCLLKLYFYLLSHDNFLWLLLSHSLISIPAAAYYAILPVILVEMFPIRVRCTVLAILYATASCFAAGLTLLLALMLAKQIYYDLISILLIAFLVICIYILHIQLFHKQPVLMAA